MAVKLYPFDFFVLNYDVETKDFVLVLVSSDNLRDISIAKTKALHCFGFTEKDVPVIINSKGTRYYYSYELRSWFCNPRETFIRYVFSFLVPPSESCKDIFPNGGGVRVGCPPT